MVLFVCLLLNNVSLTTAQIVITDQNGHLMILVTPPTLHLMVTLAPVARKIPDGRIPDLYGHKFYSSTIKRPKFSLVQKEGTSAEHVHARCNQHFDIVGCNQHSGLYSLLDVGFFMPLRQR